MRDKLRAELERALVRLLRERGDERAPPDFALEVPRSPEHGNFACNAAMLLAKRLRASPRPIAEALRDHLGDAGGLVARSEVAGPGFLNLWLAEASWHDLLREVLRRGPRWGRDEAGAGRRVQVEFVSANPTGPLTLGHGRQGVIGDCLARLLEARGYEVTREYYFNDGGRQMRVLGQSVKARYLEQLGLAAPPPAAALADPEAPWPESVDGLPVVFPRDGYRGEYISDIARRLREGAGDRLVDAAPEEEFRRAAEDEIFAEIRRTLDALGIAFDVYTNERSFYEEGALEAVVRDLGAAGLVYREDGATWLRSTALGLERDRVLVRRTGEPTYLLPDIAYHRQKFQRGFDVVIDVQGADHIEQFPYVTAALGALGLPAERVELVMHQFVTLTRGGVQVKQSTRRASYVTVDELLEDVGVDVLRFFMAQRRAQSHLDFDLDLAEETDWTKNPAYYLQYAHARTCGIARKAAEEGAARPEPDAVPLEALALPEEEEIVRKLAEYPEVVGRAAESREPHHVAFYLRDLAGLWNPYVQDGVHHRVVSEDRDLTAARLALAEAVRTTLANGLGLLGLRAPERM